MLALSIAILLLLTISACTVSYRLRSRPSPELFNNRRRIHTWWIISAICITVFYYGDWALQALIFTLVCWAWLELLRMEKINYHPALVACLMLVSLLLTTRFYANLQPSAIHFALPLLLLAGFLLLPAPGLRFSFLLLFCLTAIESVLLIAQWSQSAAYEPGLILLYLFLLTALNDIAQYFCGQLWGRTPLAPTLSPHKTLQGALGGIVFTVLLTGATLPMLLAIEKTTALLIGFTISVLGITGDLCFSHYKRLSGIKDSGASLPGHGGLLDRIDSLTLTAPGFGLCLSLLG
ncbi:MAG: phosphatidate cytidylyltransferase [Gammaproteobacteria bacterium]|nr:phosphatidate cytidylyltransferase [Gammaproteobacteria bacterium]MDH5803159.1 phosphatidate cytidylyltransferase [Gammaproteobacteria bacterium]